MDIEIIQEKVKTGKYIISFTHTEKIRLRKIEVKDIETAIIKLNRIQTILVDQAA